MQVSIIILWATPFTMLLARSGREEGKLKSSSSLYRNVLEPIRFKLFNLMTFEVIERHLPHRLVSLVAGSEKVPQTVAENIE